MKKEWEKPVVKIETKREQIVTTKLNDRKRD